MKKTYFFIILTIIFIIIAEYRLNNANANSTLIINCPNSQEPAKSPENLPSTNDYTVWDHCQNCFIVSENNGNLYGVIGKDGEEILPVQYDKVYFLNYEKVMDGTSKTLYIQAKNKNSAIVIDGTGKEILDKNVVMADFALVPENIGLTLFTEKSEKEKVFRFYKSDGKLLSEVSYAGYDVAEVIWLSKDFYLLSTGKLEHRDNMFQMVYNSVTLYNSESIKQKNWDGMYYADYTETNGSTFVFYLMTNEGAYYQFTLDKSGSLTENGEIGRYEFHQKKGD